MAAVVFCGVVVAEVVVVLCAMVLGVVCGVLGAGVVTVLGWVVVRCMRVCCCGAGVCFDRVGLCWCA